MASDRAYPQLIGGTIKIQRELCPTIYYTVLESCMRIEKEPNALAFEATANQLRTEPALSDFRFMSFLLDINTAARRQIDVWRANVMNFDFPPAAQPENTNVPLTDWLTIFIILFCFYTYLEFTFNVSSSFTIVNVFTLVIGTLPFLLEHLSLN